MAFNYVYDGGKPTTQLIGGPWDGRKLDMLLVPGDRYRLPVARTNSIKPEPVGAPVILSNEATEYVALTYGMAVYAPDCRKYRVFRTRLEVDLSTPGADDPGAMASMLDSMPPFVHPAAVVLWCDDRLGINRAYIREGLAWQG